MSEVLEDVPVVLVACEPEFAPAAAAPALGSVVVLFWSMVELLDEVEDCGTAVVPPAFGVVLASGVAVLFASGVAVVLLVPVVELLPTLLGLVWSLTAGVVELVPCVEVAFWSVVLPVMELALPVLVPLLVCVAVTPWFSPVGGLVAWLPPVLASLTELLLVAEPLELELSAPVLVAPEDAELLDPEVVPPAVEPPPAEL
jgi:hypothetical protein